MKKQIVKEDFTPYRSYFKQFRKDCFLSPIKIVGATAFITELTPSAQAFYQKLCLLSFQRANKNGWFPISTEELMELTGIEQQTLRRAKKELEDLKMIEVGRAYDIKLNVYFSDCYRIIYKESVIQ